MCFRFASCIGVHVRDDDVFYGPTPPIKAMPPPRHASTTKTPAPAPRYVDSNAGEARRGTTRRPSPAFFPAPAAVAALTGGTGAYDAGAEEQQAAGADEALKRPAAAARNIKVAGHGAGNGAHQYRYDEHEQPAREEGNKDCYPTATAASDHERC